VSTEFRPILSLVELLAHTGFTKPSFSIPRPSFLELRTTSDVRGAPNSPSPVEARQILRPVSRVPRHRGADLHIQLRLFGSACF
jgi:hypothetical protein